MPPILPTSAPETPHDGAAVRLEAFSYDERRDVLPLLSRTLENCGAFVLERRTPSASQIELRFELQIRSVLDLYALLMGVGIELTRGSHLSLTGLCTVRQHRRRHIEPFRVLTVTLEVSFLEELNLTHALMPGAALA